jgi:hypothetical protein
MCPSPPQTLGGVFFGIVMKAGSPKKLLDEVDKLEKAANAKWVEVKEFIGNAIEEEAIILEGLRDACNLIPFPVSNEQG